MSNIKPRVLYLHGLRGGPNSERAQILHQLFGKDNVCNPNLKTRRTLILFTILFLFYICILIAITVVVMMYAPLFLGFLTSILLILLGTITYILLGRAVTQAMVTQAISIAEKSCETFRPNVIGIVNMIDNSILLVASSFGAIISLYMDTPRIGLILLAPAQDAYCRYMKKRDLFTLDTWPFVLIVHGSRDDTINLDDSIRLVETSDYGKCKLEVIDDDHDLNTLSLGDFRDFVNEAYIRSKEEVFLLAKQDIQTLIKGKNLAPLYDITLYDVSEKVVVDIDEVKQKNIK